MLARDLFRYLLVNGYLLSRSSASDEPVRLRARALLVVVPEGVSYLDEPYEGRPDVVLDDDAAVEAAALLRLLGV